MTWSETHHRTRIIREVEAYAVCDPTGHLPWKESWAPWFGDRETLLAALRARWNATCQTQLDTHAGESVMDSFGRLRRTHASVLRILEAHEGNLLSGPSEPDELARGAQLTVVSSCVARVSTT